MTNNLNIDTYIDKLRTRLGITLEEIYHNNIKNKNEIKKIHEIFYPENDSKEKLLALLYIVSDDYNDECIQIFRKETGLTSAQYDSNSSIITKYNILLVTALIYHPSLFSMIINYREAINLGFSVIESEKGKQKRNILPFKNNIHLLQKKQVYIIAGAAALIMIFFLAFLTRSLIPGNESRITNAWISNLKEPEKTKDGSGYIASMEGGARLGILSPLMGRTMNVETKQNDAKFVISSYSKAIRHNTDDDILYVNRGVAYTLSGYLDTAIKDFNKAIELNPMNTCAYYNRAIAYAGRSDMDLYLAISDLEFAITITPDDKELYYLLGALYIKKYEDDQNKPVNLINKALEYYFIISGYKDVDTIIDYLLKTND